MERTDKYETARKQVEEEKSFYKHLLTYILVISFLWVFNSMTGTTYWWAVWPTIGWGIGIFSHGFGVFGKNVIFGQRWEERRMKQLMEKEEGDLK